jgi:hypothetical protein
LRRGKHLVFPVSGDGQFRFTPEARARLPYILEAV